MTRYSATANRITSSIAPITSTAITMRATTLGTTPRTAHADRVTGDDVRLRRGRMPGQRGQSTPAARARRADVRRDGSRVAALAAIGLGVGIAVGTVILRRGKAQHDHVRSSLYPLAKGVH